MPGLWTYPWNLFREGLDGAFADLADRNVDTVACAAHYHSVRSLQPRFPESLFESYAGGCYFDPDPARFSETPIDPVPNRIEGVPDPLAEVVDAADGHGIDVAAWTVCLHNSRLGREHPEFLAEDAFGTGHEHAFCPSNEAVGRYFAAVAEAAAARGASEVQLESVGFQSVFHGHDTTFAHDKRQVLTTPTEEWLFSQCFCAACRDRAGAHEVDLERARSVVRGLVRDSFDDPHSSPPSLDALVREHDVLGRLFDFRASVVTDFVSTVAAGADDAGVNCYLMDGFGPDPGAGWPAGVRLSALEEHVDRVTALCYVSDPRTAADRVRGIRRAVDVPVDVGLTLDPSVVERESDLHALVDAVTTWATGRVQVYHHGLATERQLDWVERAFAAG